MVLAQKEKYIWSMEQDRKLRKNPHTHDYLNYDKGGKNMQWRRDSFFNEVVVGKLKSYMWKNEIRTLPNTMHKNKFKIG